MRAGKASCNITLTAVKIIRVVEPIERRLLASLVGPVAARAFPDAVPPATLLPDFAFRMLFNLFTTILSDLPLQVTAYP